MATHTALILAAACLCVQAIPQAQPPAKNTIFGDETLEGQIFQNADVFGEEIPVFRTSDNPYRLPRTTIPYHYNIRWDIDIDRLVYSGRVEINLVATQAGVTDIVIHSTYTEISSLILTQGTTVITQNYTFQLGYQFLIVSTPTPLVYNAQNPVTYTLTIDFGAPMRSDMYGIYRSWFRNNATDQVSWMATTQFQATSARFAFPCYDEPSFKATFNITIRRPIGFSSWSNTRIANTVNATIAGYEDDIYHTTPTMSTYLLALIVAEYSALEQVDANGTLVYEIIARPAAIEAGQGQYAFDVGQDLLEVMSKHTNVDFYTVNPNLKMTQAAIPDFSAGAMENWGLLTYREAYLMYDEQHSSSYNKQLIAYILSHEIAHMWFGNLVTCDWWDVLWLNEGFARYYQYFLTHWVETEMGFETRFIVDQVHSALLSDSANNPHPLTNPGVGSPQAISNMFSTLSYNKGAAIIRMTEHLLDFATHEEGLRRFLRGKAFGTALPIDLFEALQAAALFTGSIETYGSEFNVMDYYRSWTEQAGCPVLNVQVNHQTGDMLITQRRFNINTGYSNVNTNWIIPITFATPGNANFSDTKPSHIIRDTVSVINRGSVGDQWVIFNKQQTGYYRVNYDDYTWNLIIIALRDQNNTIHEYNKAQIVNDVFQFARSGIMSYTRAFNILSFLANETSYAPWVAAVTGFSWIRNRLVNNDGLQTLIARWASNVMSGLTYYPQPNEIFMRSYLRYQLAPTMCAMNVRACREAANAQFRNLVDNGVEVPVDSRVWVYCNGLREGSQSDFDYMWNRYQTHPVYTEKILLLQTLGCTPHQQALNTFLDGIVQENNIVRHQDYTTAFNSAVTGNENNTQIVFQYIQNNLQPVINAFGSATTPLSYISTRLRTEQEIVAFQNWATENQATLGASFQAVFNGAENSRESLRWAAANADDIGSYIVNGDDDVQISTPAATPPPNTSTVPPPALVEPETPDLTDAASTTYLSMMLLGCAAIANFAFA